MSAAGSWRNGGSNAAAAAVRARMTCDSPIRLGGFKVWIKGLVHCSPCSKKIQFHQDTRQSEQAWIQNRLRRLGVVGD